MKRHTTHAAQRMAAANVLLITIAAARPAAQSAVIGPSRPGGNPMSASSTSYPGGLAGAPLADVPQHGNIAITNVTNANSGSLLVANSAYIRLRYSGQTSNGGASVASSTLCRLSVNVVDATHVTVNAARGDASGITATCYYELNSIKPQLVKSIQRGQTSAGTSTISAVTLANVEFDYEGTVSGSAGTSDSVLTGCAVTNSTTVTCTNAATGAWQVTEWN